MQCGIGAEARKENNNDEATDGRASEREVRGKWASSERGAGDASRTVSAAEELRVLIR